MIPGSVFSIIITSQSLSVCQAGFSILLVAPGS